MVQVDIFWSFAIGSSFAVGASRQLKKAHDEGRASAFDGPYFTKTVLFLATIFAPSGIWLLWSFPSWETMHVGDRGLPGWLVALFAVTNITQGVLGYWCAHRLIVTRRIYGAYLCIIAAYFLMFFVLVHGWDGTGYQRFFSATQQNFLAWGQVPLSSWFSSDVAFTLYFMGLFLLPLMLGWIGSWLKGGPASQGVAAAEPTLSAWGLATQYLAAVLIGALGSAIVASLLIRAVGAVLGTMAFVGLAWFFTSHRYGLYRVFYRSLGLPERPAAASTRALA